MKNLVITSLFCMSVFLYPMQPEEKVVLGGLATLWAGCLLYEFFIKDPVVRAQERQERERRMSENNIRVGMHVLGLQKVEGNAPAKAKA